MADFGGDAEAFRLEARSWLEENFPQEPERRADGADGRDALGGMEERPDAKLWRERMGAKGWGTPTWPKQYGGGGLTRQEARVLAEEMARLGARNPIGGMGVSMFGPTLLEYGTEAQKQQHIPPIARGELRWCQGYSEPGAGSDLASLQTKAEDKGDHYLVNGSKIWTSGRPVRRLVLLPGAHRPEGQEARGHLVPDDRHALARRRGAADPLDQRHQPVLRDLLHRREGAEGEPVGPAERRLDRRQAPAAVRAGLDLRGPRRRQHRRARRGDGGRGLRQEVCRPG
jgi:alkylation response protein AidB-like acyl-CoA dehydrogenase